MPNTYTPEQIGESKEWLKDATIWGWPKAKIALAALEAAEKERDEWRESARTANTALLKVCKERDALAAYISALEKAGDGLADYHRPLNTVPRWQDSLNAWDAARKEKPGA